MKGFKEYINETFFQTKKHDWVLYVNPDLKDFEAAKVFSMKEVDKKESHYVDRVRFIYDIEKDTMYIGSGMATHGMFVNVILLKDERDYMPDRAEGQWIKKTGEAWTLTQISITNTVGTLGRKTIIKKTIKDYFKNKKIPT